MSARLVAAALLPLTLTAPFLVSGCGARGDVAAASAFEGEVDASCGSCRLGLDGPECQLAVRIEGRALLVSGAGIDDHGDAHAPDGFCNVIRRARVRGRIDGERFVADAFELLPPR
jgi:hypothetical protein